MPSPTLHSVTHSFHWPLKGNHELSILSGGGLRLIKFMLLINKNVQNVCSWQDSCYSLMKGSGAGGELFIIIWKEYQLLSVQEFLISQLLTEAYMSLWNIPVLDIPMNDCVNLVHFHIFYLQKMKSVWEQLEKASINFLEETFSPHFLFTFHYFKFGLTEGSEFFHFNIIPWKWISYSVVRGCHTKLSAKSSSVDSSPLSFLSCILL